jgi:hypothetical protein
MVQSEKIFFMKKMLKSIKSVNLKQNIFLLWKFCGKQKRRERERERERENEKKRERQRDRERVEQKEREH